jgi:Ca-activated chloride channel family protein
MKLALVVIVLLTAPWRLYPQERPYRFDSRVQAVTVDVAVTRDGRPLDGLTSENFKVLDNGVLQEIDLVQVETAPVNAVLVLDISESVAGPKLGELRAAVADFVAGLRESDRAALVTFSHHAALRQDFTEDRALLLGALDEIRAWGNTALNDALFGGLMLAAPPVDRPVVVLFSDGLDNRSRIREPEVLEAVRESNAVVYAVRSSPSSRELWDSATTTRGPSPKKQLEESSRGYLFSPRVRDRDKFLRDVAGQSGGRLFRIDDVSDIEGEFLRILEEIKSRYLLTYYPKGVAAAEPGWHRLEVELVNHEGEVHARRGYYPITRPQGSP